MNGLLDRLDEGLKSLTKSIDEYSSYIVTLDSIATSGPECIGKTFPTFKEAVECMTATYNQDNVGNSLNNLNTLQITGGRTAVSGKWNVPIGVLGILTLLMGFVPR